MVRRRVGIYGLLLVIGLTSPPAEAGDRKSARRDQTASEEMLGARPERIVAKSDLSGAGSTRALQIGSSSGASHRPGRSTGTPTEDAKTRKRQSLTLFRIDSKFGDVAVEPVFGKVNGVQLSLGF